MNNDHDSKMSSTARKPEFALKSATHSPGIKRTGLPVTSADLAIAFAAGRQANAAPSIPMRGGALSCQMI